MKDFCLYADRMLVCEEQFCISCEIYRRFLEKTDNLMRDIGCEEITKKCIQDIPSLLEI